LLIVYLSESFLV